jgi:hypothetical protein
MLAALQGTINRVDATVAALAKQQYPMSNTPRRKPAPSFRRQPTRSQDPARTERLVWRQTLLKIMMMLTSDKQKLVRDLMNNLMGIKNDCDVVNLAHPPTPLVMNYETDDTQGPALKPMNPHLAKGLMEFQWNQRLCEMFIPHFEMTYNQELTLEEQQDVGTMFEERLVRLHRKLRETSYKTNETVAAYRQRISSKTKTRLDRQRPTTRRGQVSSSV